jgi:ketosteroid isomerase-like protein
VTPTAAERDALFKTFGRAWFKRDVALLFEVVSPDFVWLANDGDGRVRKLTGRSDIAAEFEAIGRGTMKRRFEDVVYHHAADATFMTFRLIETDETGAVNEEVGIERYTFVNGRIALKDVYRKPRG